MNDVAVDELNPFADKAQIANTVKIVDVESVQWVRMLGQAMRDFFVPIVLIH
jgi:hypothetical protein